MNPIPLRRELFTPVDRRGLIGEHGDSPRIFHGICEPAALSSYSKPMLVIFLHVLWINRKDSIMRRVVSDPIECSHPVVGRFGIGPFDMGTGRKELALNKEHPSGQGQEH